MLLTGIKKSTLLDYPGKIATIVFTLGCNFRCGYCHNSEFVLPEKIKKIAPHGISEEIFFRFLKTRKGFLDGVVICGGEPTIHADLPSFCQKIRDLWFLVKLDTNGSNPAMLEKLIKLKLLDYVAMDVKFPLRKYAKWVGAKIDTTRMKRSIALIMKLLPDYEFRTTIAKWIHTEEDIEAIAKSIKGAKNYFLQNFEPWNTLDPKYSGKSFSDRELHEFKKIAEKYVGKVGIRK